MVQAVKSNRKAVEELKEVEEKQDDKIHQFDDKFQEHHELIEDIQDNVEEIKRTTNEMGNDIEEIRAMQTERATEKCLAHYFNKIADGLQRELGEKKAPSPKKAIHETRDKQTMFF